MPGRKRVTKFDRCLKAVKKKGGALSPGAVCQKSVGRGNKGHRKRTNYGAAVDYSLPKLGRKLAAATKSSFAYAMSCLEANGGDYKRALKCVKALQQRRNAGKMYLTSAEAKKLGLASNQEQIDRYNKLIQQLKKETPKKKNPGKTKRNPVESATAAYRDFHGKEPAMVVEVETPVHYHGVLAGIGRLEFLDVKRDVDGGTTTIHFGKGTYLSENEKRSQLFISGGDQSVNLRDFGIKSPHETEALGEVTRVGYFTEKRHLIEKDGGKGTYVHKFKAPRPTLIYDTRNKLLSFAGGGYTIPSEGIDG